MISNFVLLLQGKKDLKINKRIFKKKKRLTSTSCTLLSGMFLIKYLLPVSKKSQKITYLKLHSGKTYIFPAGVQPVEHWGIILTVYF